MEVHIGLDVSLASTAVCVLGEKGKIVTEAQVASAPDALVSFLRELPHGIAAIGLEAGPLSQWLHKGLTDAGFETVLMETRQVKAALKAMPIKTDRRDAEGIARLLQMGWFRPVHCKTVSSQEIRALLTSRKSVKDALVNMELSLRGVLRNFGMKLGAVSKGRWEARVWELIAGNAMLEAAAEPILRARQALRRELAGMEKLVRNLAVEDPVLRSRLPAAGRVVADRRQLRRTERTSPGNGGWRARMRVSVSHKAPFHYRSGGPGVHPACGQDGDADRLDGSPPHRPDRVAPGFRAASRRRRSSRYEARPDLRGDLRPAGQDRAHHDLPRPLDWLCCCSVALRWRCSSCHWARSAPSCRSILSDMSRSVSLRPGLWSKWTSYFLSRRIAFASFTAFPAGWNQSP